MLEPQPKLIGFENIERADGYKDKVWIDFIPPSAAKIYNVLSYGGGQQTFAMLVLVELGKLPRPDLIIFADTEGEQFATYQHIKEYVVPLCERLEIPFVRVTRGSLYKYMWEKQRTPMPPTCTTQFKIAAINAYTRHYFECTPGIHSVDSWIGISTDEDSRADSVSNVAYIRKTFPLLELGLSRADCQDIINVSPYPLPPKSGCRFCPNRNWEKVYYQSQDDFREALALEDNARASRPRTALPAFGRSLLQINRIPGKGKGFEEDVNCATGVCFV